MLNRWLFAAKDIAPLVVFRVFFGLLMVAECWGAIATGWVKETFVEPQLTFTFIGFEWTQFLVGPGMYVYFFCMGIFGWLIALGARYRFAAVAYAVLWSLVYFMQKSHYNNHYYLVVLMAWFMALAPAHRSHSYDARKGFAVQSDWMPNWVRLYFVFQVGIVYFFAAIAKLYPGWMQGDFLRIRLEHSAYYFKNTFGWDAFASFLANDQLALGLSWGGFWFDLLIVPLLLWKPTRKLAFVAALIFHLFNSVSLQIGIFPYFALALAVFFFPDTQIRKLFLRKSNPLKVTPKPFAPKTWIGVLFVAYFVWQIYLPLRHWHIPGDVLWTEEGHRLSWRMMLRTKGAITQFHMQEKGSTKKVRVHLHEYLSPTQQGRVRSKPDMMWQFAQHLKRQKAKEGKEISVFVSAQLSVNGGPYHPYIDPEVDLAAVSWNYFGHQSWILPEPESYSGETNALRYSP